MHHHSIFNLKCCFMTTVYIQCKRIRVCACLTAALSLNLGLTTMTEIWVSLWARSSPKTSKIQTPQSHKFGLYMCCIHQCCSVQFLNPSKSQKFEFDCCCKCLNCGRLRHHSIAANHYVSSVITKTTSGYCYIETRVVNHHTTPISLNIRTVMRSTAAATLSLLLNLDCKKFVWCYCVFLSHPLKFRANISSPENPSKNKNVIGYLYWFFHIIIWADLSKINLIFFLK